MIEELFDNDKLRNLIGEKLDIQDINGQTMNLTLIGISTDKGFADHPVIHTLFVDIPKTLKTPEGRKNLLDLSKNMKEVQKYFLKSDIYAFDVHIEYNNYNKIMYFSNYINTPTKIKLKKDEKYASFGALLNSNDRCKYFLDVLKLLLKINPDAIDELKLIIQRWFFRIFASYKHLRQVPSREKRQFDLDYEKFKKSFLESIKTTDIEME